MEVILDWMHAVLPAEARSFFSPISAPIHALSCLARDRVLPVVGRTVQSPDLASVALLVVIFFISLRIVHMLYRAVVFWVSLTLRLLFWLAVAGAALYLWDRGFDGTVADAEYLVGYWWDEYRRFQMQAEEHRLREAAGFYREPVPRPQREDWW
ncbi:hypothetical protein BDY21DRAFT_138385 [Lineolata rhizophorae]|uniref:Nuclear pore assembly and biogenesis-domain-containing protein n=1 Tax=Lineolata rhizophorae TaxID=578093 RepID=A0A6A6PAT9_9PEZI|nr:hypothetical protein BDY21DRAFT_138385 [Lineolata rhizophorae]